jgi:hypothetical protein
MAATTVTSMPRRAPAVGQRLAEVAGARAHHAGRAPRGGLGGDGLGAASLEAAYRIERLDLQRDRGAERPARRRARHGRRVQEHRIDGGGCGANAVEPEPDMIETAHGREACHGTAPYGGVRDGESRVV